jgi:hypothetical protein
LIELQTLTCRIMKHDQKKHAAVRKRAPLSSVSCEECSFLFCSLAHGMLREGPLTIVRMIAPATVTKVPRTLAKPLGCLKSTFSSLN